MINKCELLSFAFDLSKVFGFDLIKHMFSCRLREALVSKTDGETSKEFESMLINEINSRQTDVNLRIRLIRYYQRVGRYTFRRYDILTNYILTKVHSNGDMEGTTFYTF